MRIRVITGIGDDWVLPMWGNETSISKDYALQKIRQREFWDDLIAKKKEKILRE